MEFNPFRPSFELAKHIYRNAPKRHEDFYDVIIASLEENQSPASEINQMILEEIWYQEARPYYSVYPGVIKGFLNLRLDIPISQLIFPETAFSVKFAKGKEPFAFEYEGRKYPTKAILAAKMPEADTLREGRRGIQRFDASNAVSEKIMIFIDIGESIGEGEQSSVYTYIAMPVIEGMTIEEAIEALPHDPTTYVGPILPAEFRKNLVKIVAAICLLGDDVDLKEFDVLAKDLEKYHQNYDPKFIDKAKRRGKNGWVIGRLCEDEKSPSYVNPHFQHYWTGKGRTQIILKHKKGFFTKRDKLRQVPTGHEDIKDVEIH